MDMSKELERAIDLFFYCKPETIDFDQNEHGYYIISGQLPADYGDTTERKVRLVIEQKTTSISSILDYRLDFKVNYKADFFVDNEKAFGNIDIDIELLVSALPRLRSHRNSAKRFDRQDAHNVLMYYLNSEQVPPTEMDRMKKKYKAD